MKKGQVCVIDDDDRVRQAICDTLENAGFQTSQANDGDAAIAAIDSSEACIAIIDLVMPNQEGMETIIKVREKFPDLKILAISGGGAIGPYEYLSIAHDLGADETLAKPLRAADLLRIVRKLNK